jgi:adenosylcobyric acid synthase
VVKSLSIFGTSSDVGKSIVTMIISKLLQKRGFNVVPFKAQNVSNNSRVADDGGEIALAQHFQSAILKTATSWHNNPVLLKSGIGNNSSLILKGRTLENRSFREYYWKLESLKPTVREGFKYLKERYDLVVAEGAGSPVELNLMNKDLSNIFIAEEFNTKIVLVADIERGGVFASIYGLYSLLPERLRESVVGVLINRFRGDIRLFDDGVEIIESRFKIPVLGVLPYIPFNFGFEDSQSILNYTQSSLNPKRRVAIISYPTISNYNDFEPLIVDSDVEVEFIRGDRVLEGYDLVILPGSKLVMKDLKWLKDVGLFERLKRREGEIMGICGGYEMMFERLIDNHRVESDIKEMRGLGFIDDALLFQRDKVLRKGSYEIFGKRVEGFEIHNGVSRKYPLSFENGNIKGTFVHSLFEDREFLEYRERAVERFISAMETLIDMDRVVDAILS